MTLLAGDLVFEGVLQAGERCARERGGLPRRVFNYSNTARMDGCFMDATSMPPRDGAGLFPDRDKGREASAATPVEEQGACRSRAASGARELGLRPQSNWQCAPHRLRSPAIHTGAFLNLQAHTWLRALGRREDVTGAVKAPAAAPQDTARGRAKALLFLLPRGDWALAAGREGV